MKCEIDRDAPLTPLERVLGGLGLLSFLVGAYLVAATMTVK